MDKQMKECLKPHALLHTLLGIGLGVIGVNWLGGLYGQNGLVIGLFIVLAAFMGEFYLAGQKKR